MSMIIDIPHSKLQNTLRNKDGFTIVELLIVIVVIAILATISIVAYNGIQNRAHDTAVKSDLSNFAKIIEIQKTYSGTYPATLTSAMGFKFTKNAYGRDYQDTNVRYCRNAATDSYILMVNSKSGTFYQLINGVVSVSPPDEYGYGVYGWDICALIGLVETNPSQNGYDLDDTPQWATWTN